MSAHYTDHWNAHALGDGEGGWCAAPDESAARDAEIASLRAALADEQSTRATVEQSLADQTARGMEIADERDCLADRVAAMGAAMQPFAAMSRHVKGMRDEERIFGISFVPGEGTAHVTAGHLRACQPHALDSAAAVIKAARAQEANHRAVGIGVCYCGVCEAVRSHEARP